MKLPSAWQRAGRGCQRAGHMTQANTQTRTTARPSRWADPLAMARPLPVVLARWDAPVRLSVRDAERVFGVRCGSGW